MSLQGTDIVKRLAQVEEQERKLAIEKALTLQKAMNSGDVDAIYKAQNYYQNQFSLKQSAVRQDGMKSIVFDPLDAANSMGYFTKATSLSYGVLRQMSKAPIVRAVINTRKDEVADYCKPQPDKYSKGFVIKKEGVEDTDELTDRDKKIIEKLTKFILHCGDDTSRWDLDDFETFVRKLVEDSLSLDQACAEIIPNRLGEPTQFVAVDGATFRIADSVDNDNNTEGKKKVNGYYPSYVQVYQGQVISEFYPWELIFGVRNPSTNIYANGYGRSELEDLVTTVTAQLNADKYNATFFTRGSAPKGALLVKKGNINKDRIAELRRDWNAMMSGADNAHKTPILDAESVEWLDMQKTNRDMEFSNFQEYLIKLVCAIYKISPEEIGFPLQGTNRGGLGSGSDGGKEERDYSKDKGLKPLLTSVSTWINKHILGPKTNYLYRLEFVGLNNESVKEEEDRIVKAAAVYMTVDEARHERGLKPLPNGMGKMPVNPIFSQMQMMSQQQNQEAQQGLEEQEQTDFNNTNPFLGSGDDESSPFEKAFNTWWKDNLLVK